MQAGRTRYATPRVTRRGLCVEADRFRQVMTILRADYELAPEIQAEMDALALRLESRK